MISLSFEGTAVDEFSVSLEALSDWFFNLS